MAENPFASMGGVLGEWIRAEGAGVPGANYKVLARNVKLFSRKNVGVGTAAPRTIEFFNESPAPFVQNIVSNNSLPANMAMIIHGIRFGFQYGIDREGNRLGLASPSAAQLLLSSLSAGASAAAGGDLINAQWRAAETIREFMSTPVASFGVSTTTLMTVSGLLSMPDGKGSLVQAGTSQASTSATAAGTSDIFQSVTNGAPVQGNMWNWTSPWPLAGNEQFFLEVEWPRAVDFARATIGPLTGESDVIAGTLTAELQGVLAVIAS